MRVGTPKGRERQVFGLVVGKADTTQNAYKVVLLAEGVPMTVVLERAELRVIA